MKLGVGPIPLQTTQLF